MAPFTAWLPVQTDPASDLIVKLAGRTMTGLTSGMTVLEQALADQGLAVLAQASRLDEKGTGAAVDLRISTEPLRSMGTGCDVAACIDQAAFDVDRLGLQRGSVLLHETHSFSERVEAAIPEGVITYRIPFSDLHRRCGGGASGRAFAAVGVLTHLLGIPEEAVRGRVGPAPDLRHFEAGFEFASTCLGKRDIYALPAPSHARRQTVLDARQALMLGLTIGSCDCRTACAAALDQSPDQWMIEHLRAAREDVSPVASLSASAREAYCGPGSGVTVLLGTADPTSVVEGATHRRPIVLVAADVPAMLSLVSTARQLDRGETAPIWVVADEALANRRQSIAVDELVALVREAERRTPADRPSMTPSPESSLKADRDGEPGADVGFVAWGITQGVVREAVELCRRLGMNVAALYPTMLWPVPAEDLKSFSATVKRLVIVEPSRTGRYTDLVRSATSVPCSPLMPEPGAALTPIDIVMNEGLGV